MHAERFSPLFYYFVIIFHSCSQEGFASPEEVEDGIDNGEEDIY